MFAGFMDTPLVTSIKFIDKGWKRMFGLNTPLFTIANGHVFACWNVALSSSAAVTWRCFEKFQIQRKIHLKIFLMVKYHAVGLQLYSYAKKELR